MWVRNSVVHLVVVFKRRATMNNIKFKSATYLIVVSIVLIGFSSSTCIAGFWKIGHTYTDTLEWSAGDIYAAPTGGSWDDSATKLTYAVTYNGSYFSYEYMFETAEDAKGLSHWIIEISPNVSLGDFFDIEGSVDDALYHDEHNGNPEMPEGMWGLKFGESGEVSFNSYRMPVWGDFFAKDGSSGGADGTFVHAYNTGFTSPDSDPLIVLDGLGNLTFEFDHILRPDTVVPVPGTIILGMLGLGVAGIKLRKFA